MKKVVRLVDHRKGNTKPKVETFEHGGQVYTVQYDPNAPAGRQWFWRCDYVQTFRYTGYAETLGDAAIKARKKIHAVNREVEVWEDQFYGDVDA